MADFPSYADILFDGYSVERESALIRTEMESGPPKQAKIKSRVMITHNVNIFLSSNADLQLFETWYSDDINEGSDWFNMVNPITGSTISVRFKGGGFKYSPMAANMDQWKISTQIETWSA